MTEIFTAPTLAEAKQKAADAFGVPVSEISFQILGKSSACRELLFQPKNQKSLSYSDISLIT